MNGYFFQLACFSRDDNTCQYLARGDYQLQMEAITIVLTLFGANLNITFIVKVEIIFLLKCLYSTP